jgi:hypothetical protein
MQVILQCLLLLQPLCHSFEVAFVRCPNESAHKAFDEQWEEMEKGKIKMNVATVNVECLSHGPK